MPSPASPLSLSDILALERTRLANERTVLAYLRTGMGLLVAGISLINFFRDNIYIWVGAFCLPLGLGVILLGWVRFRARRRHVAAAVAGRR